jgi:hypothetical protein
VDSKYRIVDEPDWAVKMAPVLQEVVADPQRAIDDQQPFREWVAGDRGRYEAEVDHWLDVALKRT